MSYRSEFSKRLKKAEETEVCVSSVDMHVHLVDFLQQTDSLRNLLMEMERANVERAVVFGIPVKKKWMSSEPHRPHYYLDDDARCYYYSATDEIVASEFLNLGPEEARKIAPTLCGFNPTDLCAIEYVDQIYSKYPFWRGIGELFLRHDDLTSQTVSEPARVTHPALREIFSFCSEKHIPVCLHHNSTSVTHHDHFEYLHEMEEVLRNFPQTTFVWAHCGASRRVTGKNYAGMIDDMLHSWKNLYVDFSWVVFDDIICKSGRPKAAWLKLTEKYPDRIMIGSDLCGHFDGFGQTMARYNTFLKSLPARFADMVARENAERLWFSV